ncbi:UDP-Glycosyltransferase/glycogen phosphorylase [Trametes polyzona]|nr:UDP-Glycosyltransferase/glycogen phosphorylase [Trametes polyzona]
MTVAHNKHLVAFPSFYWGHARPMSTLVARIVQLRPVRVTFLVLAHLHARVQAEVARDFKAGEEHLIDRIRYVTWERQDALLNVVSCAYHRFIAIEGGSAEHHTSGAPGAFKKAWEKLWSGEPLTCAKTGARFDALSARPSAAILDFFAVDAHEAVRGTSGNTVKVYTWFAASTNAFFHIFSEDKVTPVKEEAERTGRPVDDVMYEMLTSTSGRLKHSPCLPTMYDYEMHPQEFPFPKALIHGVMAKIAGVMQDADGLITFDAAEYHPRATAAILQYYGKDSRKAIYAGPLLPAGEKAVSTEAFQSHNGGEIMAFLDEKLKTAGERSVLYVSFGSLFWPKDPTRLWAVIDVLIEKNVPFVLSHGATFASPMPDDVKTKIKQYGNAVVSDWVPQQALLDHPATGWFLMHGGHNSTIESITAGVPMIVWPMDADQPMNAVYLSDEANVAYELIEVRDGCGLGKIYRNGRVPIGTIDAVKDEMRAVIDQAFGEDGAAKRARVQVLRKTLRAAWAEDGVARFAVGSFLDEV